MAKRFQIGAEITSRGKKDCKLRQELQISAEHYCRITLNGLATSMNSAHFVKQGRKRDSQSQSQLPKSFIPFYPLNARKFRHCTAQKKKLFVKDFFNKCEIIRK